MRQESLSGWASSPIWVLGWNTNRPKISLRHNRMIKMIIPQCTNKETRVHTNQFAINETREISHLCFRCRRRGIGNYPWRWVCARTAQRADFPRPEQPIPPRQDSKGQIDTDHWEALDTFISSTWVSQKDNQSPERIDHSIYLQCSIHQIRTYNLQERISQSFP